MAEYVQLGRLANSKSSDAALASTTPGDAHQYTNAAVAAIDDMTPTGSRAPLLGSPDALRQSEEGFRSSDDYGTSGTKSSAESDVRSVGIESEDDDDDDYIPRQKDDVHGGVQQADAINLVWSRNALILAYCL